MYVCIFVLLTPAVFLPMCNVHSSGFHERNLLKGPAQLGHSGDEIFHVVLFKTVTSYRVLKTHRPWNAYKLSPQQVTASVVPSLKRI